MRIERESFTHDADVSRDGWAQAWPDALAFAMGLALAWYGDWKTKDLVWSLWLSSLLVGYAMIVWMIFNAMRGQRGGLLGAVFMLGFFTVHFGGFHFVHSMFLNAFFPMVENVREPGGAMYGEVFSRYWIFVLVAAVAERSAFKLTPVDGEKPMANMMAPYKNVIRLHVLIFFFAFMSFAKIDNFFVYAVVYAVYFFPWRLVGKRKRDAVAA